jgi:glycosyltransferase involved in cell wall biosynthesis
MSQPNRPVLLETMLLGSSLANLDKVGSAQREVHYYKLLDRHFEVVLFEYSPPLDARVFRFMRPLFANKWLNSIMTPLLQSGQFKGPGVVRAKQVWGSWSAWLLARLRGQKFILRCGYIWSRSVMHERRGLPSFVKWGVLHVERFLIRRADALIYASDDIAAYYGAIQRKPFVVIPNGFDVDIFKPAPDASRAYDFVYVGRLIPLKGIQTMLDLVGPDRTLLIAGGGPLASLLSGCANVTGLGVVPNSDLPSVLNRARCFISMSSTEGSPKCLIEAILCGLYPVVSDIPAHRLLLTELGYGMLVQPDQDRPLPTIAAQVDQNKLDVFRKRYSVDVIVEREIAFCEGFVR